MQDINYGEFHAEAKINANFKEISEKQTQISEDLGVVTDNLSHVSEDVNVIKKDLTDATVENILIKFGMNNVIKGGGKVSISPKFTIKGKTRINLLGSDGNCENVSKWILCGNTPTLSTTQKVYGSNSIKCIPSASGASYLKNNYALPLDKTKQYLLSGYIFIESYTAGGGWPQLSVCNYNEANSIYAVSADTSIIGKWQRVGVVVPANNILTSLNGFAIVAGVGSIATGQVCYLDGIMFNELETVDYGATIPNLLAKYQYIDGYTCLKNPYIEIRHDNLIRNGNSEEGTSWWIANNASMNIVNGKMRVISSVVGSDMCQFIDVVPNTQYSVKLNKTMGTIDGVLTIATEDRSTNIASFTDKGTFNSGNNNRLCVRLRPTIESGTGYVDFDSIIIVEGAVVPTDYKTCTIERCVIEGDFVDGDSLVFQNGEADGLINWKHKILFGNAYDWQFSLSVAGFKKIITTLSDTTPGINTSDYIKATKYDNKIMSVDSLTTAADTISINSADKKSIVLSVSSNDTGWLDSINPNADEIKAYMNGWFAYNWNNQSRYKMWTSLGDYSFPSVAYQTTTSTTSASTTTITVPDGTKFSVGSAIIVTNAADKVRWIVNVASISGNVLTVDGTVKCTSGDVVAKGDNGTDTTVLNYCKNNVAPGFEGYKLHYKLQNPEPITDINTSIEGDIPKFDKGENYLFIDSGRVIDEVANPIVYAGDGNYNINNSAPTMQTSILKNKTESISSINKNGINDYNWSIWSPTTNVYGKQLAQILPANFDSSATYTVDYKILSTQAPQIGDIVCNCTKDIVSTLNNMQEEINNKQIHDSILDNIIDFSMSEAIDFIPIWTCFKNNTVLYVDTFIPLSPKKTKPSITLSGIEMFSADIDYTSKFRIHNITINTRGVFLRYVSSDTATITTSANGFYSRGPARLVADCKNKI